MIMAQADRRPERGDRHAWPICLSAVYEGTFEDVVTGFTA